MTSIEPCGDDADRIYERRCRALVAAKEQRMLACQELQQVAELFASPCALPGAAPKAEVLHGAIDRVLEALARERKALIAHGATLEQNNRVRAGLEALRTAPTPKLIFAPANVIPLRSVSHD